MPRASPVLALAFILGGLEPAGPPHGGRLRAGHGRTTSSRLFPCPWGQMGVRLVKGIPMATLALFPVDVSPCA